MKGLLPQFLANFECFFPFWQTLFAFRKILGGLAVFGMIFTCIFPKKYPLSSFMAAVEMRTLRGFQERLINPNVDPTRDRYLEWRFWIPESGTELSTAVTQQGEWRAR